MYDITNVKYQELNQCTARRLTFDIPTDQAKSAASEIDPYAGLNGHIPYIGIFPIIRKFYFGRGGSSTPVFVRITSENGNSNMHFATVDEKGNRLIGEIARVLGINLKITDAEKGGLV